MELDINQNTLLVTLISISFFMETCTLYFNSQNYKLLMKLIKHVDVVVRAQLSIAKSCNIHIDFRVCRYLDCERIERTKYRLKSNLEMYRYTEPCRVHRCNSYIRNFRPFVRMYLSKISKE